METETLRRLSFMAILTLVLVVCVQVVSIVAMYRGSMSIQEYLAAWIPLMTLALGFWFGRNGEQT